MCIARRATPARPSGQVNRVPNTVPVEAHQQYAFPQQQMQNQYMQSAMTHPNMNFMPPYGMMTHMAHMMPIMSPFSVIFFLLCKF